jgi:hypothetical protein
MEVCGGHGETNRHYTRPGLDVWVWSRARHDTRAGGGELYLISSCASGRITRLLIADVCGCGPLFDDVAGRLREIMRVNINTVRQSRSVRQMSEQLATAAQQGGFASTLLSTYFAPTRSYSLCNAGHPPPLLYRRETDQWSLLKQKPKPNLVLSGDSNLGVVDPAEYQQLETTLAVGDMVLSFSNSLSEGHRRDGRTWGIDGLLDVVRQFDAAEPAAIPQALVDYLTDDNRTLAEEDLTLILCQATESRVTWKDNLLAPLRLLRGVSDRTVF